MPKARTGVIARTYIPPCESTKPARHLSAAEIKQLYGNGSSVASGQSNDSNATLPEKPPVEKLHRHQEPEKDLTRAHTSGAKENHSDAVPNMPATAPPSTPVGDALDVIPPPHRNTEDTRDSPQNESGKQAVQEDVSKPPKKTVHTPRKRRSGKCLGHKIDTAITRAAEALATHLENASVNDDDNAFASEEHRHATTTRLRLMSMQLAALADYLDGS